jgi:hypothetical protein
VRTGLVRPLVMPDFEAVKSQGVGERRFGVFPDMAAEFALQDGVQKCAQLVFFAGREKFNPAIAQIPDGAGHVETLGYLPDRIAEANSLDVALVKDLNGCAHATEDSSGARELPARFIVRARAGAGLDRADPPGEGPVADHPNSN